MQNDECRVRNEELSRQRLVQNFLILPGTIFLFLDQIKKYGVNKNKCKSTKLSRISGAQRIVINKKRFFLRA